MKTLSPFAVVVALSVLLPAQALAQSAPATSAPAKAAVVVVQQTAPPPAKAQVVVQTSTAPAAPAPAALPKPSLSLQLPPTATLGQTLTVVAVIVAPDGTPVSGAPIDLSMPEAFLNTQSSVVVAHALTDAGGSASMEWQPRGTGSLILTANFSGNTRFGPATSNATVAIRGESQLYQQQAGVVLPGLNAAPGSTAMAALTPAEASPWPRLSGWPLVVVLAIVWSLYGRAVWGLFSIARGRDPQASAGGVR